jgi:AcrR family transcriptional regulator
LVHQQKSNCYPFRITVPKKSSAPSEDLRERIVDAAVHLLETQGPKGFGQVRVAREAGIAQGHLTYYFPRKSDLAAAVVERITRDGRREIEPLLSKASASHGEGRAALHEVFFTIVKRLLRNDKRNRVMLGLVTEALDDHDLAAVLAQQLKMQRAVMAQLIRRDPDDPDVHIALAALRGLGMENLISRSDHAHAEAVLARFRAWLDGW